MKYWITNKAYLFRLCSSFLQAAIVWEPVNQFLSISTWWWRSRRRSSFQSVLFFLLFGALIKWQNAYSDGRLCSCIIFMGHSQGLGTILWLCINSLVMLFKLQMKYFLNAKNLWIWCNNIKECYHPKHDWKVHILGQTLMIVCRKKRYILCP